MDSIATLALCFNSLLVISIISVLLLLLIYIRVGRNSLLLFCSLVLLVMFGVMLAGSFQLDLSRSERFCYCQGVILNYCFIAIHALIACMMYDAWKHVSNWRPRRPSTTLDKEKKRCCSPGYWIISFGLPVVPTLILIILLYQSTQVPGSRIESKLVQPQAFFCYISGDLIYKISTSTGWFMLFSIPGIFFSVYLLFKTIWMREKSLRRGRTTHLTRLSVVRVALATFIYSTFALASFLPTLLFIDEKWPAADTWSMAELIVGSPREDPLLCSSPVRLNDTRAVFYAYQRCPTVSSYIPCSIGIGFFLMYGFGKHARKSYIEFYKRWSCLPLLGRFLAFLRLRKARRRHPANSQKAQGHSGDELEQGQEGQQTGQMNPPLSPFSSLEQGLGPGLSASYEGGEEGVARSSFLTELSSPSTLARSARRLRTEKQGAAQAPLSGKAAGLGSPSKERGPASGRKGDHPMPFSRRVSYDVTSGRLMAALAHGGAESQSHAMKASAAAGGPISETGLHMSPLFGSGESSRLGTGYAGRLPSPALAASMHHHESASLNFNEAIRLIHPLYANKSHAMKEAAEKKKWMMSPGAGSAALSGSTMTKEAILSPLPSASFHPNLATAAAAGADAYVSAAPEVLLSMALQTGDLPSPHMSFIHAMDDSEKENGQEQEREKEREKEKEKSFSPQPTLLFDLKETMKKKKSYFYYPSSLSRPESGLGNSETAVASQPIPMLQRVRSPPRQPEDLDDAQSELLPYSFSAEGAEGLASGHPLAQLPFSKSCPF